MSKVIHKIKFDRTYIDAALNYYAALKSDFVAVRDKKFTGVQNLAEIETMGVQVVQERIYDAYPDPGNRTFRLLYSIKAEDSSGGGYAEISLYSDPNVAAAKLLPGNTYAAFFQAPVEFSSFIKPRGGRAPSNYRPFFAVWERRMQNISRRIAGDATQQALEQLQPDILKQKVI